MSITSGRSGHHPTSDPRCAARRPPPRGPSCCPLSRPPSRP